MTFKGPPQFAQLSGRLKTALGHECAVCRHRTDDLVCCQCVHSLAKARLPCDVCGIELGVYDHAESLTQCGDCLKLPKPYTRTVTPFLYLDPLCTLVHRFKQGSPSPLGTWFARQIIDRLRQSQHSGLPDMLVSVPSPRRRLFQRGYNPAQVLARALASQLHLQCTEPLRRYTYTEQKNLKRVQRLRNLRDAFECNTSVKGLRIAVIDDVITTCSTAISVSNTLLKQGATEVEVWAIARTP